MGAYYSCCPTIEWQFSIWSRSSNSQFRIYHHSITVKQYQYQRISTLGAMESISNIQFSTHPCRKYLQVCAAFPECKCSLAIVVSYMWFVTQLVVLSNMFGASVGSQNSSIKSAHRRTRWAQFASHTEPVTLLPFHSTIHMCHIAICHDLRDFGASVKSSRPAKRPFKLNRRFCRREISSLMV